MNGEADLQTLIRKIEPELNRGKLHSAAAERSKATPVEFVGGI